MQSRAHFWLKTSIRFSCNRGDGDERSVGVMAGHTTSWAEQPRDGAEREEPRLPRAWPNIGLQATACTTIATVNRSNDSKIWAHRGGLRSVGTRNRSAICQRKMRSHALARTSIRGTAKGPHPRHQRRCLPKRTWCLIQIVAMRLTRKPRTRPPSTTYPPSPATVEAVLDALPPVCQRYPQALASRSSPTSPHTHPIHAPTSAHMILFPTRRPDNGSSPWPSLAALQLPARSCSPGDHRRSCAGRLPIPARS
jgi:hypothetical protein